MDGQTRYTQCYLLGTAITLSAIVVGGYQLEFCFQLIPSPEDDISLTTVNTAVAVMEQLCQTGHNIISRLKPLAPCYPFRATHRVCSCLVKRLSTCFRNRVTSVNTHRFWCRRQIGASPTAHRRPETRVSDRRRRSVVGRNPLSNPVTEIQ